MKIHSYHNMMNQYLKTGSPVASPSAKFGAESALALEQPSMKVDRFVSSRSADQQGVVSRLRQNIVEDILSNDSPARIEELRASIREGTYQVSGEELAKAILSHAMI